MNPLHFEYIVYPLWRRKQPTWLRPLTEPILQRFYPVTADRHPPESPAAMARHLVAWGMIDDAGPGEVARALESSQATVIQPAGQAPTSHRRRVHIPAQWEPIEKVLISWGVQYPPIWPMHAEMAEAISQVATAEILVPTAMWGHAVWLYLREQGRANLDRVQFLVLPTNDIWIRDYGPIMGLDASGAQVVVNPIYAVLPQYPQADDNAMIARWAGHYNVPVHNLALHTEGGNLWSDGLGTLMMSEQIFYSNRYHSRDSLENYLSTVLDYEKLIITPRLTLEETGHIDLLVKLASADTLFVSAPTSRTTATVLRKTRRQLERATNAAGIPYNVVELPTPSLYLNWFVYTIRRAYTNALTVNGRVLVPVFGIPEDDIAIRTYEATMPGYEIVPIDSRVGINGGGAVHCMTKEVPRIPGTMA